MLLVMNRRARMSPKQMPYALAFEILRKLVKEAMRLQRSNKVSLVVRVAAISRRGAPIALATSFGVTNVSLLL